MNSKSDLTLKHLDQVMQRDRFRLRRTLERMRRGELNAAEQQKLVQDFQKSTQRLEQRRSLVPEIHLDPELPIFDRAAEIAETIRDNPVTVIAGATGSGKSTQLPLIALQAGFGVRGVIGHTQPRRIAARGVAARVAEQLRCPLGNQVGFKIRFNDRTDERTLVKLMTDGILLAETQTDRFLDQYDLIIVDEAHERSLNIDFLLGILHRTLRRRPDLRLVITSATIDTQRFAEHFQDLFGNPVPVIEVEGRTWPVEIEYRPLEDWTDDGDVTQGVVDSVQHALSQVDGDLLVFLPTEHDIRTASRKLKGIVGHAVDVLPLYARLSTEQQNLIFRPGKRRRVVLATNVAESSVTVPRIRAVIDTGTARISRYAPRSKVQRLPIEPVSQASADQRAGRCGRIGPGLCIRLYSEEDYQSRPRYTTPEIRRTNLASVILQSMHLKLGALDQFPFIDPPGSEAIRDGYRTLTEIQAIDRHRRLTPLGKKMARLPVDPRIARMVFAADQEGCLGEILIIAAALEVQDPRIRPAEQRAAADAAHEAFQHPTSDFLSYLKLWDFVHELREKLSRSQFQKACRQNFLSTVHLRNWTEVYRQLQSMVRDLGLKPGPRRDDHDAIHRSLLTGLLSGIAQRTDRNEYTAAGGVKFFLWPGSGLFESRPEWIVVSELVETGRRYGRVAAAIDPRWLERLASHLVRRRYVDPHWSRKRRTVMGYENVTLFGLPIVARRRVKFGPHDPETARELFVQHALVDGDWDGGFDFYQANRDLLSQLEQRAAQTRDSRWIPDPYRLAECYRQRLPDDVFDAASLKRALRQNEGLDDTLRLEASDVCSMPEDQRSETDFPPAAKAGSMVIPIDYRFQPGADDDGATIRIPRVALGQLDDVQLGWLIPGWYEPRIIAMIRSLPKAIRRQLVPAPETAAAVARSLAVGEGRFEEAVARELSKIAGQPIEPGWLDDSKAGPEFRVNIEVIDDDGEVVARGRSMVEVRSELPGEPGSEPVVIVDTDWHRDGLVEWDWDELPESVRVQRGNTQMDLYPAIMDQGEAVGLRLFDSADMARTATGEGLTRLLAIRHRRLLRSQVNWLPDFETAAIALAPWVDSKTLKSELMALIARVGIVEGRPWPNNRESWEAWQEDASERIGMATQDIARWLSKLGRSVQNARLAWESIADRFEASRRDIENQVQVLLAEGFLIKTPWTWLREYPRYFEAIAMRVERLPTTDPQKELAWIEELAGYWSQYSEMLGKHRTHQLVDPELDQFRWMIEEYRVSLFAQRLGTRVSVSPQRLERQWQKVRRV